MSNKSLHNTIGRDACNGIYLMFNISLFLVNLLCFIHSLVMGQFVMAFCISLLAMAVILAGIIMTYKNLCIQHVNREKEKEILSSYRHKFQKQSNIAYFELGIDPYIELEMLKGNLSADDPSVPSHIELVSMNEKKDSKEEDSKKEDSKGEILEEFE